MCSLHSVVFLFVVCALFCIACRSPALSLSFIGRRRVDPRKACHLGEISRKNSPGCLAQNFHLPSRHFEWSLKFYPSGHTPALPPPQKNKVWLQQACSRPQKLLAQAELSEACHSQSRQINSTPRGFEPLRAEPIGFRVELLSRSDTVSSAS